jgi:aromatic ring hydroxylase
MRFDAAYALRIVQEIFLLPGGAYREADQDYAVACVVPRDIEGLTIVEATRPSDRRDLEETASCMPSYQDLNNPEYGHLLRKYLKAGACSAETRFKAARLAEWLTVGGGIPGCMHGGGSPDVATLFLR